MGFLTTLGRAFLDGVGPIQARTESDAEVIGLAWEGLRARRQSVRPWRSSSVNEALSVPAIFGAVSLIAGTMGTLTMDAYLDGTRVPAGDRPRLIVRPNPLSKPYTFHYLTAFYKAVYGERWLWVASRDVDGIAESLYPVPPWEVTVTANLDNRLRPEIKWGDRIMRNEDMVHDIWFPSADGLRGQGPLQKAGAAVSVAVEAQEWAANFYAGSLPSIIGTTDQDMDSDELAAMDRQWMEKPPNLPRWLTNGLTLSESPIDPTKAQLTDARQYNVADVARMFSMPGSLLESQMSGSSLTYRNDEGIWTDFQRRCIGPIFAEPVEQDMSDLLTRSWTVQYNFDRMLRADLRTRFESYKVGIEAGFMEPDEARQREGWDPGASEYAPVPKSPPSATPTIIPMSRSGHRVECPAGHLLAELATPPYQFTCPKCHRKVAA